MWGRNDPLILPPAGEFVKQVVPEADPRYFDASHFALDENAGAIIETFSLDVCKAQIFPSGETIPTPED